MAKTADNTGTAKRQAAEKGQTRAGFRQVADCLVCLAIAAILVRGFEVEGYIISTGSMAPSLLGYHKRLVCPECRCSFPYGVTADAASEKHVLAVCPNCGRDAIDITRVPRNEGDQLLMHKNAFILRQPRRWEVVVFQNPDRPMQAYVKRVVGLPGERVQILEGDVYVDGRIARKGLIQQRGIRIPVYDDRHHAGTPSFRRQRWVSEPGWQSAGGVFRLATARERHDNGPPAVAWVTYRHWIHKGGTHETSVDLDRWPSDAAIPDAPFSPVAYDAPSRRLICRGVMPPDLRDRLSAQLDDPQLQSAVAELDRRSHVAPITDSYGYNHSTTAITPMPVRDLMTAIRVTVSSGSGQFLLSMPGTRRRFSCVFDLGAGEVRLLAEDEQQPLRVAPLPNAILDGPALIEMSTMDRQVLVAVSGDLVFPPWTDPTASLTAVSRGAGAHAATHAENAPRQPLRFGACRLDVSVDSLVLYRDVFYRKGHARNGIHEPCQLGEDEYFVLGDNSPVSLDSRGWDRPAVEGRTLLGKPFLVHLPSRQGKIRFGHKVAYFRIPDISRIRYIH